MDAFAFETAEEVFSNSVVIRVALAGHTLADTKIRQPQAISVGGILDTPVRVEDETRSGMASADGGIQSGEGEVCVNVVREGVTDDLLGTQIFDSSEIKPAFVSRDIGDIANPSLVRGVKRKVAHEQIRSNGMRMPGVRSRLVSAFAYGGNAKFIHEAMDALARTGKFFADQMVQAVQAKGRILHMQRQQPAFERLIMQLAQRRFALQPFIVPAAGDFE